MSNSHYDTSFKGLCYVNRVRMVTPDMSDAYRAVTLSVKSGKRISTEGKGDKPQFTISLDCKVVGTQAQTIFDLILDQHWDDKTPPVISAAFEVGDIAPNHYTAGQKSNKAGEIVDCLRGRLLKLHDVYVNGVRIDEPVKPANADEREGEFIPGNAADSALPLVVELSKDDPDFERKKTELEAAGYQWDDEEDAYYRAAA